MASRTSQLIAQLVDRVSGPAAGIEKSLKNVGSASKKAMSDARDNPLGARGSAALVDRVKKLDRETAAFSRRYEISAIKGGRVLSTNLKATTAAMVAQSRVAEMAGRKSEAAYKRATAAAITHYRATTPAGNMYKPGVRNAFPAGYVMAPAAVSAAETAKAAASNAKTRASTWVAANATVAGAAGAAKGAVAGAAAPSNLAIGAGVAGAGAAVWALMRKRAEEERAMRATAISAGVGDDQINPAIARLRQLQDKWAVPFEQIKKDFDELIVMGKTWSEALQSIEGLTIGRAAYGSGFGRLQTLVSENFDMDSPEAQQRALQIISGAGKSGRFEISDFTRRFPKLAPMFKSAGFKGEQGLMTSTALMQILMGRFGTPDQAAVGMENLLGEFISPVTKARFKKQGVDLDKLIDKAEKAGKNGFEEVLAELVRRTGGDERKLGEFFRNKNSLQAISALVTNYSKIAEVLDTIGKNAQTAAVTDARRNADDAKAKMDRLGFAMSDLASSAGQAATRLTPMVEMLTAALRKLTFQNTEKDPPPETKGPTGGAGTAAGGAAGAAASLAAAKIGLRFVPGIGWMIGAGMLVGGLAYGENNVAPGDAQDRRSAWDAQARRWRRPTAPPPKFPSIGTSGSLQFGLNGFTPSGDVPNWNMPGTGPMPPVRPRFNTDELDKAQNVFEQIKAIMDEVNGKTATPKVNTSELQHANTLLDQALSKMTQLGAAASRTSREVEQNVRRVMRASYADYAIETSG